MNVIGAGDVMPLVVEDVGRGYTARKVAGAAAARTSIEMDEPVNGLECPAGGFDKAVQLVDHQAQAAIARNAGLHAEFDGKGADGVEAGGMGDADIIAIAVERETGIAGARRDIAAIHWIAGSALFEVPLVDGNRARRGNGKNGDHGGGAE